MIELDGGAQALWTLHQLAPDRGVSNVATALEVQGPIRWWPLKEALTWLVARHPALRASFVSREGRPFQVRHDPGQVRLEPEMLACEAETLDADLTRYAVAPFDLRRAPLVRVAAVTDEHGQGVLCLVAHHIVIDATSLRLLLAELAQAYAALADTSEPPDLPAPSEVSVPRLDEAALAYWREHLAGFDPAGMVVSGARPTGDQPTFAGEQLRYTLSAEERDALAVLRRACRATDASVLLAMYYLALCRHGAAKDAVVGVLADTRGPGQADGVGYHVATMPLRVGVLDADSVVDLVGRVSRAVAAGLEHGVVPFEVLARDQRTGGDWRSWLVRYLYNYRPVAAAGASVIDVSTGLSRFDMELTVDRIGDETTLKLLYSTEVHDREFARAFLDRLAVLLVRAARDPDRQAASVEMATDADRRVIAASNRTKVAWSGPPTVLGMIVRADPDAVAIVDRAEQTTYGMLLSRAAAVRDAIVGEGASVVAAAGPRGAALAATALGAWAAGAAYLPLDPDYPASRLVYLMDDVGCRLVFDGDLLSPECTRGRTVLDVPEAAEGDTRTLAEPDPRSPAYVIHTSGSTGQPKGVRITHANLANLVRHFGPIDSMLWLTTFAFDISALELFGPLAHAGRVVVAPDRARTDAATLLRLVEEHDVEVLQATPTTWRLIAPLAAGRLTGRRVLCGGEPLSAPLAHELLATGARVHNVYGPTETTIWSTSAEVDDGVVTVGRPISNTCAHILDARGRIVPVGLPGELCLSGDGVALGYHERPELTADRFVDDPAYGRYYRSGDLARWRPDGTIELLGRADRQIKLRGHRIELGEVEAVLEAHPRVTAAAAVTRGDSVSGFLAAFAVTTATEEELWAHAAARLPAYSVPGRVVPVQTLPTTNNGKVDHRALMEWPLADTGGSGAATADELEETLLRLWTSVLGRTGLDRDANFFLNGGHSLQAVALADRATDRCGAPVTMGMIFRAPTPAALAALIRAKAS